MLKKKSVTIKGVAERANVSTTTVSFVLNGRADQSISEEVTARVLKATRELNYHPHAAAADLARKRSNNIAIIFYKEDNLIANQFYSFVVQGAIKQAIESDYNVLFSYMDATYSHVSHLPKIIREKNAQGAIFIRRVDARLIADIQARGIPVVAIDHHPPLKDINSLQIDNRRGGVIAAEHLINLGHRRLAFLSAAGDYRSIVDRGNGFAHTLAQHGISKAGSVIESRSLTFEGGYESASQLLRLKRHPTALFCANDEIAAGVLRAARERGVNVPKDLSVVGFDDIAMSNYTDPPLTTVSVLKEDLGRRAMKRLTELLEGKDTKPKRETMTVQLVIRGSTAPPP